MKWHGSSSRWEEDPGGQGSQGTGSQGTRSLEQRHELAPLMQGHNTRALTATPHILLPDPNVGD